MTVSPNENQATLRHHVEHDGLRHRRGGEPRAKSFVKAADQLISKMPDCRRSRAGDRDQRPVRPTESRADTQLHLSTTTTRLFVAQAAVASNGAADLHAGGQHERSATVTVQLHDDGGTANGGSDTSAAQPSRRGHGR